MDYQLISNVPHNIKLQGSIKEGIWPEFMFHDPLANANWLPMFEHYPEYQLTLMQGDEVIGFANAMSCVWEGDFDQLPDQGWDWALTQGIADADKKDSHSLLLGLQISVNPQHLSKGISYLILQEMINLAKQKNLTHIAIPVRPNLKTKYPLTPIDQYVEWKREDGLPLDPWLRVHVRSGGKIIKTCHQAMHVPGTIADWEEWTGMKFPASGDYIIDGALSAVKMNVEEDRGLYVEPNVWVLYEV